MFNISFILRYLMIVLTSFILLNEVKSGDKKPDLAENNNTHMIDMGFGMGLDYAGLIGVKLSYILPVPYLSIFGAGGIQLLGPSWNVGATLHILPKNNDRVVMPHLKIMYGVNRSTMVIGLSEYDKLFTGLTPGAGCAFRFGRKKAHGFDVDINYPISSPELNEQINKINSDPRVSGDLFMMPVVVSFGYHMEF